MAGVSLQVEIEYMFSLKEAALAHAKAAERLIDPNAEFLIENEEAIPVFINLLFQSVEITLKNVAIESGLATEREVRDKKATRNGHGIKEIACLINQRIGCDVIIDLLLPKRGFAISNDILQAMIFGEIFSPSRDAYAKRKITYSQFKEGDVQVVSSAKDWVIAVMSAAYNSDIAISKIKG